MDFSCLSNPIFQDDYAIHFIEGQEASLFFKNNFRLWGYNPYYFAGYPSGIFLAVDNHWDFLFNLLLGKILNPAIIFNLAIFLAYLILPFLAFLTARNFNFGKINSLFFYIFSIFLIMGIEMIRHLFYSGIYGFLLGTFLSFYTVSLFFKYLERKSNLDLAKLTFFGSLTFFVHPLSALIYFALSLPFFIFYFNKFSFKDFYKLILCLIIILIPNLLWLVPLAKFFYLRDDWSQFLQTHPTLIMEKLNDKLFLFILLLFIFSLFKTIKNKDYKFAGSVFLSYLIFFALAFFGSQIGFSNLQPERFIIPLLLLSVFLISKLFEEQIREKNILFFLMIIFLLFFLISWPVKFNCYLFKYPPVVEILNFIKNNTEENSRLHVQESVGAHLPYFGSQFTALIPALTSREVLAGPHKHPPTRFKFTQFNNDRIFGKNLEEISDQDFKKYLELYNIKYFLVFNNLGRAYFESKPEFKKVFDFDRYAIYDYLNSDESFCYKCKAEVWADYDKIIVKNASSSSTILKYHYIKTLKVKPESLKIKPIWLLDDPNPFIEVENGNLQDFYIYN